MKKKDTFREAAEDEYVEPGHDVATEAIKALYNTDTRPGPNAGKSIKHPDLEGDRRVAQEFAEHFPEATQSDAKRIKELEAECGRFENELFEARAALARSGTEPDDTKVICPNCAHQFTAISKADQSALAQSAQYEITTSQAEHDRNIAGFEAMLADLKSGRPAALAQSDAEPVAWQFRLRPGNGNWNMWLGGDKPSLSPEFYEIRPLYAGIQT